MTRTTGIRAFRLVALALLPLLAACDHSSPTEPESQTVAVRFELSSVIPPDYPVSGDPFQAGFCAHHNGPNNGRVYASWNGYESRYAGIENAVIVYDDVPVGVQNNLYFTDLNHCRVDPNAAPFVGRKVVANGVELTHMVTVAGQANEAATFRVDARGQVIP